MTCSTGPRWASPVPLARWLRGPLHEATRNALQRGALANGWFEPSTITRMLDQHASAARWDHSQPLWVAADVSTPSCNAGLTRPSGLGTDFDEDKKMKVSVFGLGYVGAVSCARRELGHDVIGVDINPQGQVDRFRGVARRGRGH